MPGIEQTPVLGLVATRVRRPARLLALASDAQLVALVRGQDEAAFEALYDRHHRPILAFCHHMLGTREEAEDALQHTFMAAFRDLAGSIKPIELRPWLFAIARNRCLSQLRARREHLALELAEPATDGPGATVEQREALRELLADLAQLPEDQRAALLLAEVGALDHADIASVLGCPREKVKALVFQARSSLTASREARATPCEQIRVELATASGSELRRGPLRRHLRTCDGCRAFKAEVAAQRKLLALSLPLVPGVALKASVLAGVAGTHGGAATGGTGGVVGGGLLGSVATTGAAKVTATLVVAGAIAAGGAFTTQPRHVEVAHRPAQAQAPSGIAAATARPDAAAPAASPLTPLARSDRHPHARDMRPARAIAPPARPVTRLGIAEPAAPLPDDADRPPLSPPGGGPDPAREDPDPAVPAPIRGAAPPGRSDTAPAPPHTPPGHGGTPPGQAKAPSAPSPQPPDTAASSTAPGNSASAPGHGDGPPGYGGNAPGHDKPLGSPDGEPADGGGPGHGGRSG